MGIYYLSILFLYLIQYWQMSGTKTSTIKSQYLESAQKKVFTQDHAYYLIVKFFSSYLPSNSLKVSTRISSTVAYHLMPFHQMSSEAYLVDFRTKGDLSMTKGLKLMA